MISRVGFDGKRGDVSLDFGIPPLEMSQTSLGGMHLIPLTGVICGARCRWTAAGMCKKLHSWTFLAELALMKDILSVLKDLSLYLQSHSASILDVAGRLDTAVRTLSAMKSVDGLALADLNSQVAADGRYCEITVNRSNTDLEAFTQMRCHSSFRPWWTTSSHASPISSFRKLAQC